MRPLHQIRNKVLSSSGTKSFASLCKMVGALQSIDANVISSFWEEHTKTTAVSASGDPIGYIEDQSGNGNDFSQSTAAARALYNVTDGIPSIAGDGVDDGYGPISFTITHPYTIINAFMPLTGFGGDFLYDGSVTGIGEAKIAGATTPPNKIRVSTSVPSNYTTDNVPDTDAWNILIVKYNGASSVADLNDTVTTGDVGTDNAGGQTLLTNAIASKPLLARVNAHIVIPGVLDDAITELFKRSLKARLNLG